MLLPEMVPTREADSIQYKEPFSGGLFDRAYGAMPANPFLNDEVKKRQAAIETEFLKLFLSPPEEQRVPEDFKQFFVDDYEIGERRRHMTNFNNYMEWREQAPTVLPHILPALERYESGNAEIGDVFDICLNTDFSKGLEVGRVTHPYWRRMEYVHDLREDVARAIEERGGGLELRVAPYRSIDITPHVTDCGDVAGFIVTYKHDVGSIGRSSDGKIIHVVERQVAGVRVDEASGFSQGVLRRMNEVTRSKGGFNWNNTTDERFEYHLRNTGARGFIEKTIQMDATDQYLVPESTTVYVFAEDPKTSRSLGKVAFRNPDLDTGIAYYGPSLATETEQE